MNRNDVLEFARALELGPPDRSSSAVWVNFKCPFAPWKHKSKVDRIASFGIKCESVNRSVYWCFACHSWGLYQELALELGRLRGRNYKELEQRIQTCEVLKTPVIRPFVEDVEVLNEKASHDPIQWPDPNEEYQYRSAIGHPYLRQRGISWATAIALGLRYDPFQRRILFPVKDARGTFAGFSGRRTDSSFLDADGGPVERDGSPFLKVRDYCGLRKSEFLLGEDRIRNTIGCARSPLILVEGLFDYAAFVELGIRNVIAVLGSNLTPRKVEKIIKSGLALVMFMDNDDPGKDAVNKMKTQLFKKCPLYEVAYPEGYEDADPASLPPGVVWQMLKDRRLVLSI